MNIARKESSELEEHLYYDYNGLATDDNGLGRKVAIEYLQSVEHGKHHDKR